MKKYDVTALGELLIDFTENGRSAQGNPTFEANPGGAPCNVLAMLSKLGNKTAFIGKVGDDFFGKQLRDAIIEVGIDASYLLKDEVHTTLALVHNRPDGDRDFSFYRNPGADMMLTKDEIPEELIKNSKIFHFGTLSMTHEGVREATKKALEVAKNAGVMISFDPNLRPPLWDSLETAHEQVLYGLGFCDVLKISDNEIEWLTGENDYTAGVEWIRERYDIPLILVSMGRDGSRAYYDGGTSAQKDVTSANLNVISGMENSGNVLRSGSSKKIMVEEKAFLHENTVDTTGAGDTFFGCILHYLCRYDISELNETLLTEMLRFANAAASIVTTRKGALRVMPDVSEVKRLLKA
ncbi:MAG: carbohydrate kinase [Lachnospiraceae bacterium]|nr:carbohydrate kinase [Lachnospiraceae bacterium]